MSRVLVWYVGASVAYFVAASLWGVVMTIKPVHDFLEAIGPEFRGMISSGHSHLCEVGWVSFALMGLLYLAVPKLLEKKLYSEKVASYQFGLMNVGIIGMVILLIVAGVLGGNMNIAGASKAEIEAAIAPFMILVMIFGIILFIGFLLFAYNMAKTLTQKT